MLYRVLCIFSFYLLFSKSYTDDQCQRQQMFCPHFCTFPNLFLGLKFLSVQKCKAKMSCKASSLSALLGCLNRWLMKVAAAAPAVEERDFNVSTSMHSPVRRWSEFSLRSSTNGSVERRRQLTFVLGSDMTRYETERQISAFSFSIANMTVLAAVYALFEWDWHLLAVNVVSNFYLLFQWAKYTFSMLKANYRIN